MNETTETKSETEEIFGKAIYAYTREQAIEDGVLVDISETAKEAGFKYPVAMTAEAFAETVSTGELSGGQSISGRLWDVVTMLLYGIKSGNGGSEIQFSVMVDTHGDGNHKTVELKALCGPGDNAEPVITIMLPDQD